MTNEQINHAIAVHVCGAKENATSDEIFAVCDGVVFIENTHPWVRTDTYGKSAFFPSASLDDCAIAERMLDNVLGDDYYYYITPVCGAEYETFERDRVMKIIRATPLQRCEAMLRAVGKWEEGK